MPGDRPDRFEKALASGADVVILDLEDAVAPSRKEEARRGGRRAAPRRRGVGLQVRVNASGSAWHDADLDAVAELPVEVGVRLPKVRVRRERRRLSPSRCPAARSTRCSSRRSGSSARSRSRRRASRSIALGEADLRSQLGLPRGVDGEPGLQWARSRVVYAAAAAGIPPPMMSVYADIADSDGLAASCAQGRSLGFVGRTAIHPAQLPVIEAAFTPTPDEVARAREIVSRVAAAAADGVGTVVLDDGTFLDVAMVELARRTLALADRAR